jgi:hypothetical protein
LGYACACRRFSESGGAAPKRSGRTVMNDLRIASRRAFARHRPNRHGGLGSLIKYLLLCRYED